MVCADYGLGQCKPPTWSKVGMEITPGELNKVFFAKDSASSSFNLGSGWDLKLFYLGLAFVVAVVIYYLISKRVEKQDSDANKEKIPQDKRMYEKAVARMGKVEERIGALEEFVQRLCLKKSQTGKMGDQRDSD